MSAPALTPEHVAHRWLSLRCWLLRTVLPAAVALLIVLVILRSTGAPQRTLDHTATMVGFAALYFTLFRGGHMMMLRSLHLEMMRKHEDAYRKRLGELSSDALRRSNVGFTLARMKRDILVEARSKPDLGLKK